MAKFGVNVQQILAENSDAKCTDTSSDRHYSIFNKNEFMNILRMHQVEGKTEAAVIGFIDADEYDGKVQAKSGYREKVEGRYFQHFRNKLVSTPTDAIFRKRLADGEHLIGVDLQSDDVLAVNGSWSNQHNAYVANKAHTQFKSPTVYEPQNRLFKGNHNYQAHARTRSAN